MRYAQTNLENVCVAVSDLSGPVNQPNLIEIGSDENPLGHVYKNGAWIAPPPAPAAPADLTFVQFVGLAMQAGGMTPQNYAAAIANPALMVFFDLLKHAQGIRKDDPMTAFGGASFVAEGMLTQAGWDAMLANWPEA